MTSSKTLKIAIPIIGVIAIGLFLGITFASNSTDPSSEESLENEQENNASVFQEDPNLQNSSSVSKEESPKLVGEITITQSSPVVDTVKEDQLLKKTIPKNFKFGNFFDNGSVIGMGVSELQNADQIHSIKFTNRHDGQINGITLHLLPFVERGVIVGIQEDNGTGVPSGNWINDDSYVKKIVKPREGKYHFDVPKSVPVSKGQVYHIVIQLDPVSNLQLPSEENSDKIVSSSVMVLHYKENTPNQPFNFEDPDIYWPDPAINSLQFDGETWMTLDKWPNYLLTFDDGKVDGQPYTLIANWVVQENRPIGQTIIPHSDYNVSKFGFLVSKTGNPTDDLYYGIQDNNDTILAGGLFVEADDLTEKPTFIEITLDESIKFNAGELYRLYVYSPIPKGEDNYNLFGHEFSYDRTVGYGGEINRLTTSSDFENWGAWYDADAVFSLTTEG